MMISPTDLVFIFISLGLMTLCGLWAVMATDILKSALALALTSVFLAIVIFLLGAPLAAVFELSVCAGLITVIFISAISMIKPEGHTRGEDLDGRRKRSLKKYLPLPFLLAVAGLLLWINRMDLPAFPVVGAPTLSLFEVMWDERRIDLVGQAIMILVGVFGIVVLFKEYMKRKGGAE
jgi:NADH-quinone oxidoreductase subunit J